MTIDLKQIIATYELAPKLEERILTIVQHQQEEGAFASFRETYDRISRLIEVFSKSPQQKREERALHLDHQPEKNRTWHQRIGENDSSLIAILEDEIKEESNLNLQQALHLLQSEISSQTFEQMNQLCRTYFETHLNLNAQEVIELKDIIEQRAQEIFSIYLKEGKLFLPRREIKRIYFNPNLQIEFGRRDFGDPLTFFRNNIDYYAQMSRTQLFNADRYLYLALIREKRIVEAIPFIHSGSRYGGIKLFRGFTSPLAYFNAHPELKNWTRSDLRSKDDTLYRQLLTSEKLPQAIPQNRTFNRQDSGDGPYRGHRSPLAYYTAHAQEYKNVKIKFDLRKQDVGLYLALKRWGQLEKIFPKTEYNYRGYPTPLDYYKAHSTQFSDLESRYELKQRDSALFYALKRDGQLKKVSAKYERKKII